MPSMAWFHAGGDTFETGELRLLGLPALLLEERGWACSFRSAAAGGGPPADIVVLSAATLAAIASTSRWPCPPRIIVSLEDEAIGRDAEQLAALRLAAGRIDAVVARGPVAEQWAQDNLSDRVACTTIPDIAERAPELRATAMRFGIPHLPSPASPACDRFWYAAPGDLVDDEEVAAVIRTAERALDRGERMLLAAPRGTLDWLRQAGCPDGVIAVAWSAGVIDHLLGTSAATYLPETRNARRRQAKLARYRGLGAPGLDIARHEPWPVAARWRDLVGALLARPRSIANAERTLLVFLDLIQDVELAMPVLRAARDRPGLRLRVAVTRWLRSNHARLVPALTALGIVPELYDRKAITTGKAVPLDGVDAVLTAVETSLNVHKRAHTLTLEAQARRIPTFTMQHGLENVGLTYFDDAHDRSVDMRSDYVLVWFAPDQVPTNVPHRVRPRLVHVGRPRMERTSAPPVPAHPGTRILAVFENLHWERYSRRFRDQFLADCFRLAEVLEDTVVVIKPHPAGQWLTRSRDSGQAWPVNIMVADPTDPLWHDTTAASLIAVADAVVTTPSSVAVDTALEGKRVAVAGYDLDVSAYSPLPILRSFDDWLGFAVSRESSARAALARARFLERIDIAGPSEDRLLDAIESVAAGRLIETAH